MTDTSIYGTEASKELPSGASNGQIPIWNSSTNRWEAGANGGFDPTANITFSGTLQFTGSTTFAQNINASRAIVVAASAGNGVIQMGAQSAYPSGVSNNLTIFADPAGRLSFRMGFNPIVTFADGLLGSNTVISWPNVSAGTLATINNAQTFTATQTFSVDTLITNTKKITNALDASQSIHFTGNLTFNDASRLIFNTAGTARANLTNTGFAIGITDTTASARLHVKGDGTLPIVRFDDNLGVSKFSVSNGGLVNATTFAGTNSACNRYSDSNSGLINWASINTSTAAVVYQTTGLYSALTTDVINTCAVFELRSTTKGFLLPRMTTEQRDLIASPVAGLLIYNTTTNAIEVYTTSWTGFSVIGGGTGLGGT
jgi:hypothetical protein